MHSVVALASSAPSPVVLASSGTSPIPVILGNLVLIALVIGIVVLIVRRRRKFRTTLDPQFEGAPMAHGVVTDLTYQYRQVNNRPLYRITYQVHLPQGQQFCGWEEKYLARLTEKQQFGVGTNHLIAYRPGWEQVRSVPQGAR